MVWNGLRLLRLEGIIEVGEIVDELWNDEDELDEACVTWYTGRIAIRSEEETGDRR